MGEGEGITFFIAGFVLWEICQLEVTVPIRAACFLCELQSLRKQRKKGVAGKPSYLQ